MNRISEEIICKFEVSIKKAIDNDAVSPDWNFVKYHTDIITALREAYKEIDRLRGVEEKLFEFLHPTRKNGVCTSCGAGIVSVRDYQSDWLCEKCSNVRELHE